MKQPIVIGVRADRTKEVICFGASYKEARQMVAGVATDGTEFTKQGYDMLELHMIGRDTRIKACRAKSVKPAEPAKKKPAAKKE